MAQVHNRVNAGVMDGVVYGGMMEAAEPEDEEYEIGMEEDGLEPYGHVVNESSDCISFLNLTLDDSDAVPFITFLKKDGADTDTFIGEPGEQHNTMPATLLSNHSINKEDFGSLWDIKRDEYKSGRIWFKDDYVAVSFYSYRKDNYKRMYDDIVGVLLKVKEKLGTDFNIGKVMVDFWTFKRSEPIIPVRWLNNGMADALFPNMLGCEPIGDDNYVFYHTTGGRFYFDWKGDEIEQEQGYGALRESKEMSKKIDYNKYIKSLIDFMRGQHLRIDPLPSIELNPEEQDGLFIKTGYYSPEESKIVVFTYKRALKDILRTVSHEFIHHMQNLQNPDKDWGTGGGLEEDSKLRSIEGEAFLLGNIIFREWTEKMKKTKELNESKKRKKQVKNDEGELVPETCDKCGGKVVCQIHGEPVYVCKDCGKYFGTMPCNLNETFDAKKALKNLKKRRDPDNIENWDRLDEIENEIVEPDDVDLTSFNIKKHLNPKFWDDGHLDTRIRLKLLDIADDFFDSLDVDWVEPEDIIITGSIANYNWNKKYSDIDLHILVDYEDVDERVDFVREYFTLKKNVWNEKHKNLRIFGFPVEVYVQDANEPHASSGVYSIDKDKWLTEPDLDNLRSGKVNKKHVREMVSTYMNKIDCLIDIYKKHKDDEYEMEKVAKDAAEIFDEIKKMRKDDLAKYGREMCDGNIIFKSLRRSDYIGKLLKLKDLTYDKINSI